MFSLEKMILLGLDTPDPSVGQTQIFRSCQMIRAAIQSNKILNQRKVTEEQSYKRDSVLCDHLSRPRVASEFWRVTLGLDYGSQSLRASKSTRNACIYSCFGWGLPSQVVTNLLGSFYLSFSSVLRSGSQVTQTRVIGTEVSNTTNSSLLFCGTFPWLPKAVSLGQPTL